MDYSKYTDDELQLLKETARSQKRIMLFVVFICIAIIVFGVISEIINPILGLILLSVLLIASSIYSIRLHKYKIYAIRDEISFREKKSAIKSREQIVPAYCKTTVTYIGNNITDINSICYGLKKGQSYYIWKNNDRLSLYPVIVSNSNPRSSLNTIPLNDILFFEEIGERYHETKVSGGGGRNISVVGAVVGNAVAGPAGAVLLGNKGSNAVNSRDITHDTRAVSLRLANQNCLIFSILDYNTFQLVIPEKSPVNIANKAEVTTTSTEKPSPETFSSADEILKYKKLYDEGIISKEEFELKKKQLLNL